MITPRGRTFLPIPHLFQVCYDKYSSSIEDHSDFFPRDGNGELITSLMIFGIGWLLLTCLLQFFQHYFSNRYSAVVDEMSVRANGAESKS